MAYRTNQQKFIKMTDFVFSHKRILYLIFYDSIKFEPNPTGLCRVMRTFMSLRDPCNTPFFPYSHYGAAQ